MPKALERKLWRTVRRKHPRWSMTRKRAYVYGTLRKTGWVPSHQRGRRQSKRTSRGYKTCVINTLSHTKFTTPKMASAAFRKATSKCQVMMKYTRKKRRYYG